MWHYHSYSMLGPQVWSPFGFGIFGSVFFLIVAIWVLFTIVLKGYALWNSAKLGKIWWFIALLVLNTFGILELVYIFFFLKKWPGKGHADHHEHHHHDDETHHDNPHHQA